MKEYRPLQRALSAGVAVAVCVGSAVGAGVLRTPGEVASRLPSSGWILLAWSLGAVVAAFDSLILCEWSSAHPRVGGLTAFLHRAYGAPVAFISGWSILLITWPGSIAAVAVATGEIVAEGARALGADQPPTLAAKCVAAAIVVAMGLVNLLGLQFSARAQIVLSTAKTAMLAGLLVAAAIAWNDAAAGEPAPHAAMPVGAWSLATALGASMVAVLFTYDGYADAVYLAGETKEAERSLPKAILSSLAAITALYLLANAALVGSLGADRLAASKFGPLTLVEGAFGPRGGTLLAIAACVVMLGAIHSYFFTGPRIARLLAEERLALPAFGRVNARGTPSVATIWLLGVSLVFTCTNSFDQILEYTVPIIWLTNMAVAVGLLVDRYRQPRAPRPFRLRCAWLIVGAQVAIGLGFFVTAVVNSPKSLAVDAAALAGGLALHYFIRRRTPGAGDAATPAVL